MTVTSFDKQWRGRVYCSEKHNSTVSEYIEINLSFAFHNNECLFNVILSLNLLIKFFKISIENTIYYIFSNEFYIIWSITALRNKVECNWNVFLDSECFLHVLQCQYNRGMQDENNLLLSIFLMQQNFSILKKIRSCNYVAIDRRIVKVYDWFILLLTLFQII